MLAFNQYADNSLGNDSFINASESICMVNAEESDVPSNSGMDTIYIIMLSISNMLIFNIFLGYEIHMTDVNNGDDEETAFVTNYLLDTAVSGIQIFQYRKLHRVSLFMIIFVFFYLLQRLPI